MEKPGVALDDPGTARALRLSGGLVLVWILVAVVGMAATYGLESRAAGQLTALERDGVLVDGVVVGARRAVRTGPDSIAYRFTLDGRNHEDSIAVGEHYEVGEPVTVLVDPKHPSRSTLAGEQPESRGTFLASGFAGAVGLLGLGGATVTLVQWWWRRRVASAGPWEERDLHAVARSRHRLRLVDEVDGMVLDLSQSQAKRLRLGPAATHRLRVARRGRWGIMSSFEGNELALARATA